MGSNASKHGILLTPTYPTPKQGPNKNHMTVRGCYKGPNLGLAWVLVSPIALNPRFPQEERTI